MKLSLFQDYLKKKNIGQAIFIHPDPSILYFTQKKFSFALFLISPSCATIYTTPLDAFPSFSDIKVNILPKNWEKILNLKNKSEKMKKNDIRNNKIGINKEMLSVSLYEKLQKISPKASFIDVGEKIKEFRQQKTAKEHQKIKKACEITTCAFEALIKELPLKKLHTEVDVALFLELFMRRQGAELAFPTIVASGKNSATPHHQTSLQKLQKGFLQLDFGAQFENYCADMSRVLYLGKPTKEEKEKYDFLLKVQEACISKIKEGKAFKILDIFARNSLENDAKFFIHSLGHGIGIEVHEAPVYNKENTKVQKNNAFTIEPGIYFNGKYGLRIEDTVLWNGEKAEVLTKARKALVEIPL